MMLDISSVKFLTKKICDIQRITSDGRADPNLALPNPSNGVEVTPLQGVFLAHSQKWVSFPRITFRMEEVKTNQMWCIF